MAWRHLVSLAHTPPHRHGWEVVAITQTAPQASIEVAHMIMSAGELERFALGVTTFVLRCTDPTCREIAMREALGSVTRLDVTLGPLLEAR